MKKQQAELLFKQNLVAGDKIEAFFVAQSPIYWPYFLVAGPLAFLAMRMYYIVLSNKGLYFYRPNMLGAYHDFDFFLYKEIESIKYGKGVLTKPLLLLFSNGRKLKIKAPTKGRGDNKYSPEMQAKLIDRIPTAV